MTFEKKPKYGRETRLLTIAVKPQLLTEVSLLFFSLVFPVRLSRAVFADCGLFYTADKSSQKRWRASELGPTAASKHES